MAKTKNITTAKPSSVGGEAAAAQIEDMQRQLQRMKSEGYAVLPATFTEGNHDMVASFGNVLNFAGQAKCGCGSGQYYQGQQDPLSHAGGFMSSGSVMPVGKDRQGSDIGTPGKGYITYGAYNNLPNYIALANNALVYSALPIKFNIDTLCGLGVEPVYRFHATVGCNENEEEIAYEHAGSYIKTRIHKLRLQLFNLLKEHEATPAEDNGAAGTKPDFPVLPSPLIPSPNDEDEPDDPTETPEQKDARIKAETDALLKKLHAADGLGYKRHADTILDDIVLSMTEQIKELENEYRTWRRTKKQLDLVIRNSNPPRLTHDMATDMATFNINFTELCLSMNGSRQRESSQWKPKITAIRYRDVLTCRKEEYDDQGVSRYTYISNRWLDPLTYGTVKNAKVQGNAQQGNNSSLLTPNSSLEEDIAALPSLDPTCAAEDLKHRMREFRNGAAAAQDRRTRAAEEGATDEDLAALDAQYEAQYSISQRPTRFMLTSEYRTSGRFYYPQPAYWTIYRDVWQFADNIIRSRAIRKQNETMFSYVLYVHQEYLNRITNQLNAQKTEQEKEAFRRAEVQKIKDWLSQKQNNGSTFAAVTFTGPDGKDHDAFRIERVDFANTKQNAEADKTEITDISSILMFAFECHPDLIGSTPGGASSSGGTYQREMLLIKQAKAAAMQQIMLYPWYVMRDFNELDPHLAFRIKQRVLTTLDASKTGLTEE